MARAWLTAVALSLAAANTMNTAPFIGRMLGGGGELGPGGGAVPQRVRRPEEASSVPIRHRFASRHTAARPVDT
ncbi:hypothetical protein NL676_001423 [Syzygium grande]|nr:hypothetical protein NL676_001423 [Syzygium grande]